MSRDIISQEHQKAVIVILPPFQKELWTCCNVTYAVLHTAEQPSKSCTVNNHAHAHALTEHMHRAHADARPLIPDNQNI